MIQQQQQQTNQWVLTSVQFNLVKVKNEGENEVFQTFHHVHRDPEVFLDHICQDEVSLDSPFKLCVPHPL